MPLAVKWLVEFMLSGCGGGDRPGWECVGLVVVLAGGQVVVVAAEEVALGGVAVSGVAAPLVVVAVAEGCGDGGERPDVPGGCEPVVSACRWVTNLILPLARVTGAAPTSELNPGSPQ